MKPYMTCLFGAGMICFASSASAYCGQLRTDVSAEDWSRKELVWRAKPGLTWLEFWQPMQRQYYDVDPEGNGITSKSYDRLQRITNAINRSGVIAQRLRMDLDNDGTLSRDEIATFSASRANSPRYSKETDFVYPSPTERRAKLDKLVSKEMQDDLDGDGIISGEELRMAADAIVKGSKLPLRSDCFPIGLDANGDGIISLEELSMSLLAAFRTIDSDGDYRLSDEEIKVSKH